jgi:hypothetical protein
LCDREALQGVLRVVLGRSAAVLLADLPAVRADDRPTGVKGPEKIVHNRLQRIAKAVEGAAAGA